MKKQNQNDIPASVNIAVFASGNGSNAENLARYFAQHSRIKISLILSDNKHSMVLARAKNLGIATLDFPSSAFQNGPEVTEALRAHNISHILLAGFLRLVSPAILTGYPGKVLNIHPALLPRYGGKGMYGSRVHQAVISSGDEISGITIHEVNECYDEGKILFQARCKIAEHLSPSELEKKIHALEHYYYPRVAEAIFSQ